MIKENDFETMRAALERESKNPSLLVRWTVGCLKEIYFGGDMSYAGLKGSSGTGIKYTPRAVRIMALLGDDIYGATAAIRIRSDEEVIRDAIRIRQEIRDLPVSLLTPHQANNLVTFAQKTAKASGRQVLGGLEIAHSEKGKELVHILYPKSYIRAHVELFASIGVQVNEARARDVSLAAAMTVLQKSQFIAQKPYILKISRENKD